MESTVVPKGMSEDLVRLRQAVQMILFAARTLDLIDDNEFETYSNTTIESMSADIMLELLRLSEQVHKQYSGAIWTEVKKRAAVGT